MKSKSKFILSLTIFALSSGISITALADTVTDNEINYSTFPKTNWEDTGEFEIYSKKELGELSKMELTESAILTKDEVAENNRKEYTEKFNSLAQSEVTKKYTDKLKDLSNRDDMENLFNQCKDEIQKIAEEEKKAEEKAVYNDSIPTGNAKQAFNELVEEKGISATDARRWAEIISRESGWLINATNPISGAYGLPQSLPAEKMASHGADWRTNPKTQLRWMLDYMNKRYGSIQNALAFWDSHGWY